MDEEKWVLGRSRRTTHDESRVSGARPTSKAKVIWTDAVAVESKENHLSLILSKAVSRDHFLAAPLGSHKDGRKSFDKYVTYLD